MRIQHNIMAMNAYRNYTNNTSALAKNLEKLSSGYRINRAGDDAAGLAISEKMRAQITALGTAQKNVKDGISLVKTAEGATQEIHDMLNRMVDLATQSANGTYQDEVDRDAIQEEFNALKTEINRIADSSNFNGIKLLDGTLGLNTKAFDVGSTIAGEAAVAGTAITGAVTAAASNASTTHISADSNPQNPSFSVDVADLTITAGTTGGSDVTVDFSFAGATGSITLAKGSGASEVTYTASQIAQKIVDAFNTGKNAAGASNTAGAISGLMFHASAVGGKINFTYEGVATATGGEVDGNASLTDTLASTFNAAAYGGAFTLTPDGKETGTAGRINCDILNAKEAIAAGATQRGGITFTLASSAIADGNKIVIDGTEFNIKMSGTGAAGANDIDLRGVASGDLVRQTVLQLSNKTAGNFTIHTEDADAGKIHLEQTLASYNGGAGKLYSDYDELSKLVSVTDAGTPAKAAGTVLDINAGEVKAGNVLTIGDKTIKFTGSETTASAVKAKIEAAGFTVEAATGTLANGAAAGFTRYIVRNTDAAATTGPQILGKGLTLQIGEDSQDYNQLSVAISDMHCESLGLTDAVTLNTQDGAQAAVDVIKSAINSVSSTRGKLGATQNRLEHTANNLSTMKENIQDAEATIRDTDIAEEMMAYTKNNILVQSAQAMLAQANQIPQGVLQLLG